MAADGIDSAAGGGMADIGRTVMDRWHRAEGSPLGRRLFSLALGRFAPYSGTIGARVEALEPGKSVVTMRDRKAVRNHLSSVHAAALMNLIEMSGSLAVISTLPPNTRMIPVRVETDFVKKARGLLTADARFELPATAEPAEAASTVTVRDADGDEVARGKVIVLIGPAG
jgi:acyl-coenzyme A thioesterase PaaI-like protein